MEYDQIQPHVKRNIIPLALGGLGLLLVLFGIFQVISNKPKTSPLVFEESQKENNEQIIVDIEGAVISSGVYKIPADSRVVDALAAAGGMSEEADRLWVEKNINLAKKATDGLKIYIPRVGEEVLAQSSETGQVGPVLNINTATLSDLESLPGIGPVTGQKIIDSRPYSQIEELLDRKIVGQATFEKIKDKISAD